MSSSTGGDAAFFRLRQGGSRGREWVALCAGSAEVDACEIAHSGDECTFFTWKNVSRGGKDLRVGKILKDILLRKHGVHRCPLGLSALLLVVLLTACSPPLIGTSGAPSILRTPQPQPTPFPLVHVFTNTWTHYRIEYPASMMLGQRSTGVVTLFLDQQGLNSLWILSYDDDFDRTPNMSAQADTVLAEMKSEGMTNVQPRGVAPTVSVGGAIWQQRSITGNLTLLGSSAQGTLVILMTDHPMSHPTTTATAWLYKIYYFGPSATFPQAQTQLFLPMLQSFSFTN